MADYKEAFVGIDVAKLRNAIAIADAGRERFVAGKLTDARSKIGPAPDA